MKVVNDLLGYNDLKIVQNPDWFSFSLDSVLLPNFVTLNKDVKNILDLGTGNAPIPMILSTLTENAQIYGIDDHFYYPFSLMLKDGGGTN